jgi:hypothetical protein
MVAGMLEKYNSPSPLKKCYSVPRDKGVQVAPKTKILLDWVEDWYIWIRNYLSKYYY